MKEHKVSIIIPVFNGEEHIQNCINSIINQTYKNIEIIIINDGSLDSTKIKCEELSRKDTRIKLINQKNAGPSVARNTGIENASGNLIQFVDVDDSIKPNMVSKLVEKIDSETDLVICGYDTINQVNGKVIMKNNCDGINKRFHFAEFKQFFVKFYDLTILRQPWNKIYKKEIISNNQIRFDSRVKNAEDLLFNLEYYEKCNNVQIIDESLYRYSVGISNSLTSNYKADFFENRKEVYIEIFNFLSRNNIKSGNKFFYDFFLEINKCFSNLFHKNSPMNRIEKLYEINKIIKDTFVKQILQLTELELIKEKFLKYLVANEKDGFIYYFYFLKNKIR